MRNLLLSLTVVALTVSPTRADDADALVDKAIRAMASSDLRLNRLSTVVRVERGSFITPLGEAPTQRTVYLCPPGQIKYDASVTMAGQTQPIVLALSGVNGWHKSGPDLRDLSAAEFDGMQDEAYTWWLTTLLPLRKKGVTLKAVPPTTIAGKAVVGVGVARPPRPDSQIYFDAATFLPVRVRTRLRESGLEVARDYELGVYKDFDGIKLPTRITVTQNGKKIEDWTVQEYKTPDKLDDKLFKKPDR
jgi:hypothetical protein